MNAGMKALLIENLKALKMSAMITNLDSHRPGRTNLIMMNFS